MIESKPDNTLDDWKKVLFNNGKPTGSITKVNDALIPVSEGVFRFPPRRQIEMETRPDLFRLIIITSGYAFLYRDDDSCAGVVIAPAIVGLAGAYRNFYEQGLTRSYYLVTGSSCNIYKCRIEDFAMCIEKNNLWHEIARILACKLFVSEGNSRILLSRKAYDVVKSLLIELSNYAEHAKRTMNVQAFIKQRGGVSRSNTMRILSEMKANNEIVLHRGKLVSTNFPVDRNKNLPGKLP